MISKKLKFLMILLIIFLGACLRFYKLGETRQGFFRDEAALGFNSWSVLKTGADEYGQKLPVFFRSFEVFFMPAYVYLSTPIFSIFGPTELSTRFLSALSGTILILIGYFVTKELFKSEKIGLLTALVISLSPWSIFYSRGAFEGNLSLLFFSLGFYLWLKFKNTQKNGFFYASLIFFVFSMYSYQAPRLIVPFFLIASVLLTRKWLGKFKLWFLGGLLVSLLYFPVLIYSTSPASYHRAYGVSLFSARTSLPGYNQKLGRWQYLYLVPREFFSLYLHYFSPSNLFGQSDYNAQRTVPNYSVFYLWQLPLFFLGIQKLLKIKFKNRQAFLLWLLISPLSAALTGDPFHTYRAILFLMPVSIVIGLGFGEIVEYFKKFKSLFLLLILIISYSVSSFVFNLLVMMPIVNWRDWDYGYKEICQAVKVLPENLRIVVDDPNTESYIHFLFYGVVPIKEYQKTASAIVDGEYYSSGNKLRPERIGRFEFRKVDWPKERGDKNTVFIFPATRLYPSEFASDPKLQLIKTIYTPGADPAFYIIKTIN